MMRCSDDDQAVARAAILAVMCAVVTFLVASSQRPQPRNAERCSLILPDAVAASIALTVIAKLLPGQRATVHDVSAAERIETRAP